MKGPKLESLIDWSGSQEEFSDIVSNLLEKSGFAGGKKISKRTLVYYRSKGLIGKPTGRKFEYKHILQCLFALKLSNEGWKIQQMSETISGLNTDELLFYLDQSVRFEELLRLKQTEKSSNVEEPEPTKPQCIDTSNIQSLPLPKLTARILAQGIVEQYHNTQSGQIVDGSNIPESLRHALGLLGKLKALEAKEDNCASVHEVLFKATSPLHSNSWNIDAFQDSDFPYGDVTLVDLDHRCPTLECLELAQPVTDANIKEKYSFHKLKKLCATFGTRRHEVYTKTRAFIIEHLLVETQELLAFIRNNRLNNLLEFLRDDCYYSLENYHLIEGKLYQCIECGSILKQIRHQIGRCTIRQCCLFQNDVALTDGQDTSKSLMVLRPHLQTFWFGPGLDEIKMFNACLTNNIQADLYPNCDECDLAIDGKDVGIDIKSHVSPTMLGESLTRSIGGLREYKRKIVSISDNCLDSKKHPDYLKKLKSSYQGNVNLEFMSVSELHNWIKGNDD